MMTLRELLSRSKLTADEDTIATLKASASKVLEEIKLNHLPDTLREDILKIIAASLDLSHTIVRPNYNIDEALINLSVISTRISFVLKHISTSRPRLIGVGVINRTTGQLLPNIWLHEYEAEGYIQSLARAGLSAELFTIIPVETATTVAAAAPPDVPNFVKELSKNISQPSPAASFQQPLPAPVPPQAVPFEPMPIENPPTASPPNDHTPLKSTE